MTTNPLRDLIGPKMYDEMDKLAVESNTERLDGVIEALAKDLDNPNAPARRTTAIVDIGAQLFSDVTPEAMSMMLSIAIFRGADALRDSRDQAEMEGRA